MNKTKLLTILITITLILTALNLYATLNLYVGLRMMVNSMAARQRPNMPLPFANQPPLPPARIKIDIGNHPVRGAEKAPVTLIEFSDYQCPFSAQFFSQTLPQIEKNYIKTGKVKMVFRDFPLAFHQNAQKAAEAAECAGEQGKYWEYHDTIFENQKVLDIASLKKYAKNLGLNMQKFNACLDSGKMAAEVKKDFEAGSQYGVSGTPCFFINGIKLEGAQPYQAFEEAIEKALKKK